MFVLFTLELSHLSVEDRIEIIELYYKNGASATETVRTFQTSAKSLHTKPFSHTTEPSYIL